MKPFFLSLLIFISTSLLAQEPSKGYVKALQFHKDANFKKAIKYYSKALKNNENVWSVLRSRGSCYFNLGKYELSKQDLMKAYQIQPNDEILVYLIYNVNIFLENDEEAIKFAKLHLKYDAKNQQNNYYDIGTIHYFNQQNDSAIKYLKLGYALDSTHTGILTNLAFSHIDGEPEKSCTYFQKAYELDTSNDETINNLGYSQLMCGNLDDAFKSFKKAEKLDPTNSFIYRNLGLYYLKKGDKINACKSYSKALEMGFVAKWGTTYLEELSAVCNKR